MREKEKKTYSANVNTARSTGTAEDSSRDAVPLGKNGQG